MGITFASVSAGTFLEQAQVLACGRGFQSSVPNLSWSARQAINLKVEMSSVPGNDMVLLCR
jgi:hypothetical protein